MSGLTGELPGESFLINDSIIKLNLDFMFLTKSWTTHSVQQSLFSQPTLNISKVVVSDVFVSDMHSH